MIVILSVKFRKHIAMFLFGIFYMQLLIAEHNVHTYGVEYSNMAGISTYSTFTSQLTTKISGNYLGKYGIPITAINTSDLSVEHVEQQNSKVSIDLEKKLKNSKSGKKSTDAAFIGGPTQPEMQAFQSVNGNNMVDLFSGDFSYNIPLLDVGGYPVNLAYHSGVTMDEDASWVGLGWNINPGSITRNMRGLPDDFDGGADTVRKIASIKANNSWGVTAGGDVELAGLPLPVNLSAGLGIFHNTYNGWGLETSLNASINAGSKAQGILSGGLSLTNNSQNGLTLNPSLSAKFTVQNASDNGGSAFGLQLGTGYNSRSGLRNINLSLNVDPAVKNKTLQKNIDGLPPVAKLSFSWPTYTPGITIPMTNYNFSFTAKLGGEATILHPDFFVSGYVGKEYVAAADTSLSLPAYGYLNFQNTGGNWSALLDYNREKEMPYREKPAIPHIAVPAYTYDVFTISGEGTGGMFRAYRGDIGFIADHLNENKTITGAASVDLGGGDLVHGGVDLNANYSTTQSGPWLQENTLKKSIAFQKNNGLFEAAYFRNPGEKAINTVEFYNAIGGDDVVAATLYQPGNSGPSILATNGLTRFSGKKQVGTINLASSGTIKTNRDKRTEVISYLTAEEASIVGLDKYINHYAINKFDTGFCENEVPEDAIGKGNGLLGYYFNNVALAGAPTYTRLDSNVFFNWDQGSPFWNTKGGTSIEKIDRTFPSDNFSVRWLGRLKAPVSGTYAFGTFTDDGIRLWIDDSLVIKNWTPHSVHWDTCRVNLVGGKMYNIRMEYCEFGKYSVCQFGWRRPDQPGHPFNPGQKDTVSSQYLYPPVFTDTAIVNSIVTRENRVNNFRKSSHISEIDVLNPDGRRYVYGIPVYNFLQKEVSFSVIKDSGNMQSGLVAYRHGIDNSTQNSNGKDGYYSREDIPAYAHSFLLTGILSPDYVDVTGDGISDDDIGDAVKFDYSKSSGVANPFEWRAPYIADSANYNEGLRSYDRDDKAHYIYGNKELWYLHSIESKTMVANFTLQSRADLLEIDENGIKTNKGKGLCIKQIDLYSKADFMKHGTKATPIKTVHFEYSYELCRGINKPVNDSGKLTLKRIWFTYNGNDKGILNPYVFNYHSNNPRYTVNTTDKWGTYKNPGQNPGATTSNLISNSEYPYSIQDSALAAFNVGAWTLDSIKLPSGGRIKVNYESDDYAYVQNRRATQMCKIAGFGTDTLGSYNNKLYDGINDQLYVYVKTPYTATNSHDLYARYLDGLKKLYFRLNVQMPKDDFGSGADYVPCYADADTAALHWYGKVDAQTIWIKIKGVNKTGDGDGSYSPLAQTALSFLRLNLPSKAYPGSEVNDGLGLVDGIKIILSQVSNIIDLLGGFEARIRANGWVQKIDTGRSFVRLNCPVLKKLGGGIRVKRIMIYDNWNAMTGKKETVYGQTYDYTNTQTVNGVPTIVSSGVASWEPGIGSDENPFHLPIEYVDRVSMLAPAATLYTEEPLGEAFYPGASIGYSNVRVRSIHTAKTRSANGYSETGFYTSYDFPTSWDWSLLNNDTKKRFKPILSSFLRINARSFLSLSQGFKIELNDMNGKIKRQAVYSETDSLRPISYTENYYRVDNQSAQFKHLKNTVSAIDPLGNIDTAATIGKDAELMADMRDQTSNSIGGNININADLFEAGILPVVIPSLLNLYQHETNQFRSVAMTKIIQRYGILDSIVHMENGSLVSSKNVLFDSETGDPLLVRTQNEFNDSLYEFAYPAHWMYRGMGMASQNIDAELKHLTIKSGKITSGLPNADSTYLTAGDELLTYSKLSIDTISCVNDYASFPDAYKLWVIDTNSVRGGAQHLFLLDQYGTPFSGNDVSLKVIRSGHRNMNTNVGSINSLGNPIVYDGMGHYHLVFDSTTRVLTAGAQELQQFWKVGDKKNSDILSTCVNTPQDSALAAAEGCSCLRPFFDYLISRHLLFIQKASNISVDSLVNAAAAAGYSVSLSGCPILSTNASLPFYALSADSVSPVYISKVGNEIIDMRSVSGLPINIYQMTSNSCDALGRVIYKNTGLVTPTPDSISIRVVPGFSVNLLSSLGTACPSFTDSLLTVDSSSDHLLVENSLDVGGYQRNAVSILRFDQLDSRIPYGSTLLSANLILQADHRGHLPGLYDSANSINLTDSVGYSLSAGPGWFPYFPLDTMLYQAYYSPWYGSVKNATPFQNDTLDVSTWVSGYLSGAYNSNTFVLTQGSGPLNIMPGTDSFAIRQNAVPPYLLSGFGNYYATFYSQYYSDSTKWPVINISYVAPAPSLDTLGALLEFNSTMSCTTITGRSCYSSVTDTLVNPYAYGILGNYRPKRSYVYYARRKESDPVQPTNIRINGTISGFIPFWNFSSGQWTPLYDTARWVWNSQTTLFNRKGFEIENSDPLGRFNSGLYGYGLTLPTAVIQNSRYQESAFEGFEDYGFVTISCANLCSETRQFDFSFYKTNISDSTSHTGIYSLRVGRDSSVSIRVGIIAAPDLSNPQLTDSLRSDACNSSLLDGIKATPEIVLTPFEPFAGKKMLVGAWVKEVNFCTCQKYTKDHLLLSFALATGDTTTLSLSPSGNIIEGWQRYESVVYMPSNAKGMIVTLQASDSSTTYFDDIRIHPFNAEMKTYVYNPVNLRLMAELDENNYASFYEYDDDGTLIRVKKETERGIQTIKETRSALLKNQ